MVTEVLKEFSSQTFSIKLVYNDSKFEIIIETILGEEKLTFDTFNEAIEQFNEQKDRLIVNEKNILKKSELIEKTSTKLINKLYTALQNYNTILLYGPTGTGKTESSYLCAKKLEEEGMFDEVLLFTMASGMDDIDLLGKFIPQTDKSLKFIPSIFLQAIEKASCNEKICIILDEFNRASPKTLNILLPLLDEKDGMYRLNNYLTGEIIEIPVENIKFIFTANFGGSYAGTYQIDPALLNRIEYVLFVDYQSDVESKIIDRSKNPIKVKELVDFFRELAKNGEIHPFSTRDIKFISTLDNYNFESLSPLIYKLVKQDTLGYPDEDTINIIKEFLEKLNS